MCVQGACFWLELMESIFLLGSRENGCTATKPLRHKVGQRHTSVIRQIMSARVGVALWL